MRSPSPRRRSEPPERRRRAGPRPRVRRRRAIAIVALAVVLAGAASAGAMLGSSSSTSRRAASDRGGARSAHQEHPSGGARAASRGQPATSRRSARRSGAAAAAAGPNLAPGSNPSVLPGPVLIADRNNDRLVEVSPQGKVLWSFPPKAGLPSGRSLDVPDDAFFSPDGRQIVATQEDDSLITVIDVAHRRIVYRYGHPGVPGSQPGYLSNPDDAMLMRNGDILAADIMNCRLVVIRPPAHHLLRQLGRTGECAHSPGVAYGSPNGAFPMSNGDTAVTEINGDWLDVLGSGGGFVRATNPPGFTYPSDTNEVRPGVFISADYTSPGAIEEFTLSGHLLWRFQPRGAQELDHPSLALPLPGGDVIANDDRNDRVIVIDPRTNRIVWQYGHTARPGRRPGYLSNPDGVDLAPPYSLTMRFKATLHAP